MVDTGNLQQIKQFTPIDATTNPSLLLSAAQLPENESLVHNLIRLEIKDSLSLSKQDLKRIYDRLSVEFGKQILEMVPGYVSTEVDPRLSFDTLATVKRAEEIIEMYRVLGAPKERVLIKIASTWEGIKAARLLEAKGIKCNMTLIFNFYQAVTCAQAGVTLISPFVGRIMDWHKKSTGKEYTGAEDPGVRSVSEIYRYFKKYEYKTIVMGASFRNTDEILELAGCDKLTISPALLKELDAMEIAVERKLNPVVLDSYKCKHVNTVSQKVFRWHLNQDPMATEKLAEGIRKFADDTLLLEQFIKKQFRKVIKGNQVVKNEKVEK